MRGRLRSAVVLGWVLLVLLVAGGVIAYVWWGGPAGDRPNRAQVSGTLLAALVIVPPVVVWSWSRRRPPVQAAPTVAQTAAAAQALADRQTAIWRRQVQVRGIRLPAPVKVRWRWADPQVAVPRDEVGATSGGVSGPGPVPGLPAGEVLGSGLVTRLHDEVYGRLPHGRLVLIGGPGAGKTAAMILLLLQALEHREHRAPEEQVKVPVPVWLTLGSWNPAEQGLREWAAATIARDHPYLRAAVYGPDVIGALFDTGAVALFLDGLDEMPDAHRARAIHWLQTEANGLRVVLTSRPTEYRATLDDGAQLPATAVIELRPVPAGAAADYLLVDRTEPVRRAWTAVTDQIRAHPNGVLAQTLNTPLTLSLARAAHPVDPTPLLDPALDSEPALRRHLLDQTLVTAYPNPRERAHATYWLGWIAHHMNTPPTGPTRDLPWWTIPTRLTSRWQRAWVGGLVSGFVLGPLGGLVFGLGGGVGGGPVGGLWSGLIAGLFAGFMVGWGLAAGPQTLSVYQPSRQELRSLLIIGLTASLGMGLAVGPRVGSSVGLVFGLGVGLLFTFTQRWSSPLIDSVESTPRLTHRQDARFGLGLGLLAGLTFGLAMGLGLGLLYGLAAGAGNWLWFGLVTGLPLGFSSVAGQLLVAELTLAIMGRRVRFMCLLETALALQVLRQAGAVYQFRHADLQDRLAERFASDHLN